ncbi:hypothetical protein ACJ6WF_01655 [Streptomyces sp. MMS24-I2-30]|uniref:hypothetical protein n=1 Tax=Streptomyces sp. MMS24-I2-30 TaxID=3351564 RepID=UPI003896C9A1
MPVFSDGLWWDINWGWMVVWLVTAVSVFAAAGLLIGARRRRRSSPSAGLLFGRTCVYLDDRQIMDTYQMNQYAVALRKEVELRTTTNRAVKLVWRLLPFISPEANYEASRESAAKYIQVAEPISVIGVILDALERSNAIVHADLYESTIRSNPALRRVRGTGGTRLSATRKWFVQLTADFTLDEAACAPGADVFTAPYGDTARVRLVCRPTGYRTADSTGTGVPSTPDTTPRPVSAPAPAPASASVPDLAGALCLAKVGTWRSATGTLDVAPLAVFR